MDSKNYVLNGHSQFSSSLSVGRVCEPHARTVVETSDAVGLRNVGCLCVSDGVAETSACDAINCKRKCPCLADVGETVLENRGTSASHVSPRSTGCGDCRRSPHDVWQPETFFPASARERVQPHVSAASFACADSDAEHSSVILDFGAGIVRHETFAELEGIEFADDTVRRVPARRISSSAGHVVEQHDRRKRVRLPSDASLDERPSQRRRMRPRNMHSQTILQQAREETVTATEALPHSQPPVTSHASGSSYVDGCGIACAAPVAQAPHVASNTTPSFSVPGEPSNSAQRSFPQTHRTGAPEQYVKFGPCNCVCSKCHALFWYEERLSTSTRRSGPLYHRCCMGGKVRLFLPRRYPEYIQELFSDPHFLANIRAYNQMFSMTSLGATIDESVNVGRGPYVIKVSGQIYHRIGRFCPLPGESPRFLQLYIYETYKEVANRLANFEKNGLSDLRPDIVQGLIELLDTHNALVQLFRTARDKLLDADVPEFKIKLFSVVGSSQHELPTADEVGAIVFDSGSDSVTDFDVVIQRYSGDPERINKLHPAYMSLHFPLLFIFGEQGYHPDLKLIDVADSCSEGTRRMSMDAYYAYLLHDRFDRQICEKNMETTANVPPGSTTSRTGQATQQSHDKGKGILIEEEVADLRNLKPHDLNKPLEIKVFKKWASRNVPDPNPTCLCFILLDKQGGAIQANVQIWDMKEFDSKLDVGACYRIEAYGYYIGIVRDVGNIRESSDSMTNRISRRNIDIQNLNGNTIVFTLWNEQAIGFPVSLCSQVEQPPIIAITSCWAKRFGGGVQLSATPATTYYINPQIPETDYIRTMYEQYIGPLPPLPPPVPDVGEDEPEPPQPHMQIQALQAIKPETNALRPFVIQAMITNIDETQGCYNFKATLTDMTGSIVITCFSPEANSLLLPVTELLSYVSNPDPYILPDIIKDLENTEHIFTVHIAPGGRTGNTKYILDHAQDVPRLALPEIPTTTDQPEPPTSVTQQPSETLLPETPVTQPRHEQPATPTEITTSELTPPPRTDESIHKAEYHTEASSGTVHRRLFAQHLEQTDQQDITSTNVSSEENVAVPVTNRQQQPTDA
ncbi:helitron helicase-like domain-containing protein [Artemisia annua]|uniref:Helitron helicase-like domain-containing protein n=1 Tax=Artemisia annua TaxID=35608 RepID=A0A2U1Q919_ARTAN|nr:helitron helicase-like domain-containing protein [Artemisia annua]